MSQWNICRLWEVLWTLLLTIDAFFVVFVHTPRHREIHRRRQSSSYVFSAVFWPWRRYSLCINLLVQTRGRLCFTNQWKNRQPSFFSLSQNGLMQREPNKTRCFDLSPVQLSGCNFVHSHAVVWHLRFSKCVGSISVSPLWDNRSEITCPKRLNDRNSIYLACVTVHLF